jgi:hypothetical protein
MKLSERAAKPRSPRHSTGASGAFNEARTYYFRHARVDRRLRRSLRPVDFAGRAGRRRFARISPWHDRASPNERMRMAAAGLFRQAATPTSRS